MGDGGRRQQSSSAPLCADAPSRTCPFNRGLGGAQFDLQFRYSLAGGHGGTAFPRSCLGRRGARVIADIARTYLTPRVRERVDALLATDGHAHRCSSAQARARPGPPQRAPTTHRERQKPALPLRPMRHRIRCSSPVRRQEPRREDRLCRPALYRLRASLSRPAPRSPYRKAHKIKRSSKRQLPPPDRAGRTDAEPLGSPPA